MATESIGPVVWVMTALLVGPHEDDVTIITPGAEWPERVLCEHAGRTAREDFAALGRRFEWFCLPLRPRP